MYPSSSSSEDKPNFYWAVVGHLEGADDIVRLYSHHCRQRAIDAFTQEALDDCEDSSPTDNVIIVAIFKSSAPIYVG